MGGKYGNGERISRDEAYEILLGVAAEIKGTDRLYFCGSYRRRKETCGDGDIVVLVPDDSVWTEIMETLGCDPLTTAGKLRKSIFIVRQGFQIDIGRARDMPEYGSMVLTMTGSAEFNVACRSIAKRKGFKLNQYGLWDRESGELMASGELGILTVLGLSSCIDPSSRIGWSSVLSS